MGIWNLFRAWPFSALPDCQCLPFPSRHTRLRLGEAFPGWIRGSSVLRSVVGQLGRCPSTIFLRSGEKWGEGHGGEPALECKLHVLYVYTYKYRILLFLLIYFISKSQSCAFFFSYSLFHCFSSSSSAVLVFRRRCNRRESALWGPPGHFHQRSREI